MKKLSTILLVLLIGLLPFSAFSKKPANDYTLFGIYEYVGDVEHLSASGILVEEDKEFYLLTAKHVLNGYNLRACSVNHNCIELDKNEVIGPFLSEEIDKDWAYWKIDKHDIPWDMEPVKVSKTKIKKGDQITVKGNPIGRFGDISTGFLTNKIGDLLFINARILPGNSGGPVYNKAGEVVGLVVAMDMDPRNGVFIESSGIAIDITSIWFH